MADYPKCIRCGICCIYAPCEPGYDKKDGRCAYFIINKKTKIASCRLYDPSNSMWKTGCFVRSNNILFDAFKSEAESKIGFPLMD